MWRLGLATGVVVYAVDQLSKLILIDHLQEVGREVVIPGLFNLVMVWNPGISFGLWRDGAAGWVLVTVALIVVAALAVWLWRTRQPRPALAIGMIIGGAVGNVTDRIAYSAVADFFDFHVGSFHWPAFNVADSAIVIGILILLVDGLWSSRERTNTWT